MVGGALQQFADGLFGSTSRCPETGGESPITWLSGEPYCGDCGQAVEVSGLLRREYDHPD